MVKKKEPAKSKYRIIPIDENVDLSKVITSIKQHAASLQHVVLIERDKEFLKHQQDYEKYKKEQEARKRFADWNAAEHDAQKKRDARFQHRFHKIQEKEYIRYLEEKQADERGRRAELDALFEKWEQEDASKTFSEKQAKKQAEKRARNAEYQRRSRAKKKKDAGTMSARSKGQQSDTKAGVKRA